MDASLELASRDWSSLNRTPTMRACRTMRTTSPEASVNVVTVR
jgi:hypothetical protein